MDLRRTWRRLKRAAASRSFPGSRAYWSRRYEGGGNSGPGSEGELARFKATVVNRLVSEYSITSIVELGCGDGRQLALLDVPRYLGLDVAPRAVELCRQRFAHDATRAFRVDDGTQTFEGDMALSMDVLLHLVEDDVFETYLRRLFAGARRLVVIYDVSREADGTWPHVRYRAFAEWIDQHIDGWQLAEVVSGPLPYDPEAPQGTSDAEFHVYVPA